MKLKRRILFLVSVGCEAPEKDAMFLLNAKDWYLVWNLALFGRMGEGEGAGEGWVAGPQPFPTIGALETKNFTFKTNLL